MGLSAQTAARGKIFNITQGAGQGEPWRIQVCRGCWSFPYHVREISYAGNCRLDLRHAAATMRGRTARMEEQADGGPLSRDLRAISLESPRTIQYRLELLRALGHRALPL